MTKEEIARQVTRNEFGCKTCEDSKSCMLGSGTHWSIAFGCYADTWEDGYLKALEDNPILQDIADGKAIIVDKGWLEQHDRQMIDKACRWLQTYFTEEHQGMTASGYMIFETMFKKAME